VLLRLSFLCLESQISTQTKLDLEGGYLARTIRETRVMLNSALKSRAMPDFLRSDQCTSALSSVIAHLESAERWEAKIWEVYGCQDHHTITRFLDLFLADVATLDAGKMMVWGGGWDSQTKGKGHSIMHVLHRDEEDLFTLTTCNTGAGLKYHNSSARCFPKSIRNLFLSVRRIPRARIVDDFSWAHMMWGLRFQSLDSNCSEVRAATLPRGISQTCSCFSI
jgi:hypothetical protein